MNALTYARVSTAEQAELGFSLRHQKDALKKYCLSHNIDLIKHFEDDASGKDFNRPAFQEMLRFIRKNKNLVDVIYVTRWDRFSRDLYQSKGMFIELSKLGVNVQSIEQEMDLSIPENVFILNLNLAVAEMERGKIAKRTQEGMTRGKKEGCWMGTAPFGYKNSRTPDNKSTLIPDERAALVKKAFKLYEEGIYSAEEVRKRLVSEGMTLNKQSFYNMLTNIAYTGKILIKHTGKQDSEIVSGLHEGIIDKELFEKVQDRLFDRHRQPGVKKRRETLPLRNYLICPECGKNLTGSASRSRNGSRYEYYHCNNNSCKVRFRADKCNEDFYRLLLSFKFTPEVVKLYMKIIQDVFKTREGDKQDKINDLNKKKKPLLEKIHNAEDKYFSDKISEEAFQSATARYRQELNEIEAEIDALYSMDSNFDFYVNEGLPMLTNLDKKYLYAPVEYKQKIIGSIFPEKLIYDGKIYRTARMNEVIYRMTSINNGFGRDKKRKTDKIVGQSIKAPPSGLEPETL